MSYFAKNATVQRTMVITYFDRKYVTATGLAQFLAQSAAYRLMSRFGIKNPKKYGVPHYSDKKGVVLWKENLKRLRQKFYRRALPHLERLFAI